MLSGPLKRATNTLPGRSLVIRSWTHLPNWALVGISAPQLRKIRLRVFGLMFLEAKVTTAFTLWVPKPTFAGLMVIFGWLLRPILATVLPSTVKTVLFTAAPFTPTVKGFEVQAPGTMPDVRPAVGPGVGT